MDVEVTEVRVNYRYIATEVGNLLKYDTSVNEITRKARAIFPFEKEKFTTGGITSVRAQEVYDWILTLAKQEMEPSKRNELLMTFCRAITPEEKVPDLKRILEVSGRAPAAIQRDAIDELLARGFHEEVVLHAKQLFADGHYLHSILEASKAYNRAVQDKSGLADDGQSLMLRAWDAINGILKVTPCVSETDKNVQNGLKFMSAGLMAAIRNPTAHEPALDWPIRRQECLELLGLVSFLFRKLEEAVRA